MRYLWMTLAIVFVALVGWLQIDRAGPRTRAATNEELTQRVHELFDAWHAAAAEGNFDGYFSRMTPDAVFLGTDATERWVGDEFREWARPYFDGKEAWTYLPTARFVAFAADGSTAWIDETLSHARYGTLRGTGVARRDERTERWTIAHYSLTFLVPNGVAGEVVERIDAFERAQRTDGATVPSDP